MSDILGIALSGAAAATKRIDATAAQPRQSAHHRRVARSPWAPAPTAARPTPSHHQPARPGLRRARRRHQAALKPLSQPFVQEYGPSSSDANAEGHGRSSHVETDQQITADPGSRAYSANLSMARTSSDMMKDLLNMTA